MIIVELDQLLPGSTLDLKSPLSPQSIYLGQTMNTFSVHAMTHAPPFAVRLLVKRVVAGYCCLVSVRELLFSITRRQTADWSFAWFVDP